MTTVESIDLGGRWRYVIDGGLADGEIELPVSWWLAGLDPRESVTFSREIEVPEAWGDRSMALRFEAVDYSAEVRVDGRLVGSHVGGFAPFEAALEVEPGRHFIEVTVGVPRDEFGTAFPHTKRALRGVLGHHDARPGGWGERGQERSSGGIWGAITLLSWHVARQTSFALATRLDGADAEVEITAGIELEGHAPRPALVRTTLTDAAGSRAEFWNDTWLQPGDNVVEISGRVLAPRLWWTWDQGEPHRYDCVVTVEIDGVERELDRRRVGLCEVRVTDGWDWTINGRRMFARGSNYIGTQWLSELTPEFASRDIRLATEANLNLLRVHAHVSSPAFYEACDRAGVLVWQDLPLQWGYVDDGETYAVGRRMVEELVALHGWRPSIAVWCAHNESPWNEPWLADEAGAFVPDQNQLLDHELAERFRQLDPHRRVVVNSGADDGHTYPGWYWGTWTDAAEVPGGRMVSEYGAQAVPDRRTLDRFLPEGSTRDDWTFHGFQHDENLEHVGVTWETPRDELIRRTQHYQARLIQFSTEAYRRKIGDKVTGLAHFMLVDPWECVSWSVLDVDRVPKSGYRALARAMQPVLASIETAGDAVPAGQPAVFGIWWINDLSSPYPGATLGWRLLRADGSRIDSAERRVDILPFAGRRVMQAGPFALPAGSYRIEADIRDAAGLPLSENEWLFEVTE